MRERNNNHKNKPEVCMRGDLNAAGLLIHKVTRLLFGNNQALFGPG